MDEPDLESLPPASPPASVEERHTPWVQMRTYSFSPTIYPAMIKGVSSGVKPGDFVTVYNKDGRIFGAGLYNPKARVPLRVLVHGDQPADETYFTTALERAADWRTQTLGLDARVSPGCRSGNRTRKSAT